MARPTSYQAIFVKAAKLLSAPKKSYQAGNPKRLPSDKPRKRPVRRK